MDYRAQFLQQKYSENSAAFVKEGYINDLSLRERQFKLEDTTESIDPRVMAIERMAEINYVKQKQNEIKHLRAKQRESSLLEQKQKQDEYKERLLDYKIQESQAQYLTNYNKESSFQGAHFNDNIQKNDKSNTIKQHSLYDFTSQTSQKFPSFQSQYMLSSSMKQDGYQKSGNGSIQQLPLSQSFRSNQNSSQYNNKKEERERISFRNKSSVQGKLMNISQAPSASNTSTKVKLIPFATKIKNEQQVGSTSTNWGNKFYRKEQVEVEHNNQEFDSEYEQDYTKLIIQAKYLISQNNLKEAETLLENLILKIPFHSDCLYLLGDTKRIIGKFRESEILLQRCMQQENYTPFVYKSLAETYFSQLKYQEATFFFKKYLLFKKDDDEAISLLGQSLLKLGEHLEASACFNKALEINQDKFEYYLHRSEVNDLLGLRELSQRDYLFFKKNKSEYLEKLSEMAQKQRNCGKNLESQRTLALLQQLIPIN